MLRFFKIFLLLLRNNKYYFLSLESVRSVDKDNAQTVSTCDVYPWLQVDDNDEAY